MRGGLPGLRFLLRSWEGSMGGSWCFHVSVPISKTIPGQVCVAMSHKEDVATEAIPEASLAVTSPLVDNILVSEYLYG